MAPVRKWVAPARAQWGPGRRLPPDVEEHVLSVLTVEKTTNFYDMGIRAETVACLLYTSDAADE